MDKAEFKADKDYNTWMLLSQIYKLVHKARVQELLKYDITPEQAGILFSTKAAEAFGHDKTLTTISRFTVLEPHSVSEILSRMEKNGLITKTKGTRNVLSINITEKGQHAYELSTKREPIRDVMSCLSEGERQQLDRLLKKLLRVAIRETTKPIGPPPISDILSGVE